MKRKNEWMNEWKERKEYFILSKYVLLWPATALNFKLNISKLLISMLHKFARKWKIIFFTSFEKFMMKIEGDDDDDDKSDNG